jgi:hypothetical protein
VGQKIIQKIILNFAFVFSTLRVLLWIGAEKVWCAEPWSVCTLRSFFFTLISRNAKETPQDPRAGKLWEDLGE